MVCLGPRKKDKKTNLDDARGLKKSSSKLRNSKTSGSLAPSSASVRNRPSFESAANKAAGDQPSRTSLLSNERTPSPVHRSTSPHKPPGSRPASILSVKSNHSVKQTMSTSPSHFSTASKKRPLNEMKEEVKDLKAKNEENLKLIADQKAELELLKQKLEQSQPSESQEDQDQVTIDLLRDKEEQLLLREKEIEELRSKLESQPFTNASEYEESMAEILAQKEKILEEKEAQLQEQKRIIQEKEPHIEKVAKQLETLKLENLDAVNQLAAKEKELEELRAMVNSKYSDKQREEERQTALNKIEELNKQLEAQKKTYEESLRLHEKALAEKDNLLQEQQSASDALEETHRKEMLKLQTAQANSIAALKQKHIQEKLDLENQLEEAQRQAESNSSKAANIDDQLERILHEFEQAEHTHAVQIQDMEQSHQFELTSLQNNQKAQVSKLKRTQDLSRDKWSSRYLPTDAVSWPTPSTGEVPKLRPTSLVESKSKTLLRVLGSNSSNAKPEPVLTPLDTKKVQVYYSSVSSNLTVKKHQDSIQQLLNSNKIKFSLVDVALSEAARQYAKKCNNNGRSHGRIKDFPQLYVGGEYRGQYQDVVRAIDEGTLEELLHPAEERNYTASERAAIKQAEAQEEMATSSCPLPPIESMPVLKPSKSIAKSVRTLKDYDEDEEFLRSLEKDFDIGKINLDSL